MRIGNGLATENCVQCCDVCTAVYRSDPCPPRFVGQPCGQEPNTQPIYVCPGTPTDAGRPVTGLDVFLFSGRCYTVTTVIEDVASLPTGTVIVDPATVLELVTDCNDNRCPPEGEWILLSPCHTYTGPPVYACSDNVTTCGYVYLDEGAGLPPGQGGCFLVHTRGQRLPTIMLPGNAILLPGVYVDPRVADLRDSCCECNQTPSGTDSAFCEGFYLRQCNGPTDDRLLPWCCCGTRQDQANWRISLNIARRTQTDLETGAQQIVEMLNAPVTNGTGSGATFDNQTGIWTIPYRYRIIEGGSTAEFDGRIGIVCGSFRAQDMSLFPNPLLESAFPLFRFGDGLFEGMCLPPPGLDTQQFGFRVYGDVTGGCMGARVFQNVDMLRESIPGSEAILRIRHEWQIQLTRAPRSSPCAGDCATIAGIGRTPKVPVSPVFPGSTRTGPLEVEPTDPLLDVRRFFLGTFDGGCGGCGGT